MVHLPDSFRIFAYQTGIDSLRDAYRASLDVLDARYREATAAHQCYLESGGDDDEYDEDGVLIHSTRHALDYAILEAATAIQAVLAAFVTSTFHYWERAARGWTGLHQRTDGFRAIMRATDDMYGVSPHLVALNELNNLIKHDNSDRARALAALRPDWVRLSPTQHQPKAVTTWSIRISNSLVSEALEIIRESGPRERVTASG